MTTSRQRLERVRSAYTAGHTKHQRCKNRSPVAASSPMSFSNTFLYWVAVCERINYSAILSASDGFWARDGFLLAYWLYIYIYILHKCTCAELHQAAEKHFLVQRVGETTHILRGKQCKILLHTQEHYILQQWLTIPSPSTLNMAKTEFAK